MERLEELRKERVEKQAVVLQSFVRRAFALGEIGKLREIERKRKEEEERRKREEEERRRKAEEERKRREEEEQRKREEAERKRKEEVPFHSFPPFFFLFSTLLVAFSSSIILVCFPNRPSSDFPLGSFDIAVDFFICSYYLSP